MAEGLVSHVGTRKQCLETGSLFLRQKKSASEYGQRDDAFSFHTLEGVFDKELVKPNS